MIQNNRCLERCCQSKIWGKAHIDNLISKSHWMLKAFRLDVFISFSLSNILSRVIGLNFLSMFCQCKLSLIRQSRTDHFFALRNLWEMYRVLDLKLFNHYWPELALDQPRIRICLCVCLDRNRTL